MSTFRNIQQIVLHSNAEAIDDDEGSNEIEINEILDLNIGYEVRYVRDGVDTPVRLIKLLLDPKRT